jgi:hypothetical protein
LFDCRHLAQQLNAHGVKPARGDIEAVQILGLEPARILASLHVGEQCALDLAKVSAILTQQLVLLGSYRDPGLIGKNRRIFVGWHKRNLGKRKFAFYSLTLPHPERLSSCGNL